MRPSARSGAVGPAAALALAVVAATLLPASGRARPALAAAAPTNTSPPAISGTLQDGQILAAYRGTWSSSTTITYGYQWQRCDAAGAACVDISGSTSSKRKLNYYDVGHTIRVTVTATNPGGSASATSDATAIVQALPAANTALPTISGTLQDGALLTADRGSWSGSTPLAYSYQWQRCDEAGGD